MYSLKVTRDDETLVDIVQGSLALIGYAEKDLRPLFEEDSDYEFLLTGPNDFKRSGSSDGDTVAVLLKKYTAILRKRAQEANERGSSAGEPAEGAENEVAPAEPQFA